MIFCFQIGLCILKLFEEDIFTTGYKLLALVSFRNRFVALTTGMFEEYSITQSCLYVKRYIETFQKIESYDKMATLATGYLGWKPSQSLMVTLLLSACTFEFQPTKTCCIPLVGPL